MKRRWQTRRLGAAGLLLIAIAVAAVPETTPPVLDVAAAPEPVQPRVRAKLETSEKDAVQLDMARLRRLLPAKEGATGGAPAAADGAAGMKADAKAIVGSNADSGEDQAETGEDKVAPEEPAKLEIVNAFASKSWYVPPPPPPPPKPEPPPKPTVPPLPFVYIGRYDNPGTPTVIMMVRGDRLYTVSEGDSIDGTYHIDRVEKGRVELTYLPLKQKQVLQTGEPG